jgi:hypothetical protein
MLDQGGPRHQQTPPGEMEPCEQLHVFVAAIVVAESDGHGRARVAKDHTERPKPWSRSSSARSATSP